MFLAILFWVCVFAVSIVALVKASDYFTDSAEKIGLALRLSPFVVGVTIVAIGTSIPELVSSLIAVFIGHGEIVAGTVVGANVTRLLFVLGLAAIIGRKLTIVHELISVDLPFLLGSAFLMALMFLDGSFTVVEGVISIILLIVYISYTIASEQRSDPEIEKEMKTEVKALESEVQQVKQAESIWRPWMVMLVSGLFIYLGANFVVKSVINVADVIGMSSHVIAVIAMGVGTSLPELSVTIAAARHHQAEIAVGNLLGSNIFDSLGVMGIPALFGAIAVPSSLLTFALPAMVASTLLYLFITQDKQITKWEGMLLVVFFIFFIGRTAGLF